MDVKSPAEWLAPLREGVHAVHDARVEPPPPHDRLRRVLYGLTLPFSVLRSVLRDPEARPRYLRRTVLQLSAMILACAGLFALDLVRQTADGEGFLATASAYYAGMCLAEALVLAFASEFQAEVTLDAARLTGAPAEPLLPDGPRLRLNPSLVWTKLKRRFRSALILGAYAPVVVITVFLPGGGYLYQALGLCWLVHWGAVFAIGSAPLAWDTKVERQPWLLRLLGTVGAVPVLGWPCRLYAALWRTWFGALTPVWIATEAAPYEAAGLAVARGVAGLPGLYLFLRPMFPVAATHVLLARCPPPVRREPSTVPGVEALRRAS
jgi:hypothetical protein